MANPQHTFAANERLTRSIPDIVLVAVAAVWGGSYLAAKDLSEASSAAVVMCARFLPSAVILLAMMRFPRRPTQWRRALVPGIVLGVLRSATIALETIGVTLTSATNAGLIIALSVLITPMMESVSSRRRLSASLLGSVMLAVIGLAGLVSGNGLAAPGPGDVLVLCAAVTRAALGVAEARFTVGRDANVPVLTTIEISFGAVIFTAWGGPALATHMGGFSAADWAGVAYLSLGCTVFAFLGQLWATKRTSASRAGMILGTEPGWALLIGVLLAGDRIGPVGAAGAIVLLIAILWGRRAEQRWREGAAPPIPNHADATSTAQHSGSTH